MSQKKAYNHGDDHYVCSVCGRTEEVNVYSSAGYMDIIKKGWVASIDEIEHYIPEEIIRDKYKGNRIIKGHKKIERILYLTCDLCYIAEQRRNKIKVIMSKMGS
jgi:hypothetical protein